jgi:D-alanyl-D-alanine carboxypeptidase
MRGMRAAAHACATIEVVMSPRRPERRRLVAPSAIIACSILLGSLAPAGAAVAQTIPSPPDATPVASPPPAGLTPELAGRLEAVLTRWRNDARVPGVVAAMRLPDGSVWTGAAGRRETGPRAPRATAETPWVIGSITKTFVAALAFQLQEEGRLSLDDPISTWLPDFPNGDAISLRMLLNHTSGIADFFWHPDYESLVFDRPTWHWTVDEILALAAERAPVFRPGAKQEYSNTNYILAGRILEIVGGAPLAEQLRTRFFDPLGLSSVVFQGDEPVPDGAAKGYWREDHAWIDWSDGTTLRPNTSAATVVWAAGAILASAADLLRWEQALYDGELLSPESMAQLLTFGRAGYGPGTRYQQLAGWDGYGHGGSLRGFEAVMYRMPGPNVDVVVMTNRGRVVLNGLAADLVAEVVGPAPRPSPTPVSSLSPAVGSPPVVTPPPSPVPNG